MVNSTSVASEHEYEKLKMHVGSQSNLVLSKSIIAHKIWLVGDGLREEEQKKAAKGTMFIPFGVFPPTEVRNNCYYMHTTTMSPPPICRFLRELVAEKVTERSACGGIVHSMDGWNVNECGENMFDVHKISEAALKHGFKLLGYPSAPGYGA